MVSWIVSWKYNWNRLNEQTLLWKVKLINYNQLNWKCENQLKQKIALSIFSNEIRAPWDDAIRPPYDGQGRPPYGANFNIAPAVPNGITAGEDKLSNIAKEVKSGNLQN